MPLRRFIIKSEAEVSQSKDATRRIQSGANTPHSKRCYASREPFSTVVLRTMGDRSERTAYLIFRRCFVDLRRSSKFCGQIFTKKRSALTSALQERYWYTCVRMRRRRPKWGDTPASFPTHENYQFSLGNVCRKSRENFNPPKRT